MNILTHTPAQTSPFTQRPSGLIVPSRFAPERPKGLSLFSGAGGMDLGFIMAGFHVVAAMDSDPWAAITNMVNLGAHPMRIHCLTDEDADRLERALKKHLGLDKKGKALAEVGRLSGSGWISGHPEHQPGTELFIFGDARLLTGDLILNLLGMKRGELDCVFGGPPCQGFSTSGKRQIVDPRNSLVFEFARLVVDLQPKTMVLENVPGMVSMVTPEGVPVVEALCLILSEGGMGTYDALRRSLVGDGNKRGVIRPDAITSDPAQAEGAKADRKKARPVPAQMELF